MVQKVAEILNINLIYLRPYCPDLSPIEEWDVTKVTNMSEMFYNDRNISDLSPLNSWETTNLEDKKNMFYNVPAELERPDWY